MNTTATSLHHLCYCAEDILKYISKAICKDREKDRYQEVIDSIKKAQIF